MLAGMEILKLPARINIVFSLVVVVVLLLQVSLVVRLEKESADLQPVESYSAEHPVFDYANRYIDNIAITFIPVLFLVNAGREFEQGIVHRSLISGISRLEYFISRIIQLLIFSAFAFLLAIAFTLITAAIYKLPVVWNVEKLSLYFVVSFCLGSIAFLMVLLLKKTFYSLVAFACYVIAENIFSMSMTAKKMEVSLPVTAAARMLREGNYRTEDCVILLVCTVVLLVLGYFRFLRSDLR